MKSEKQPTVSRYHERKKDRTDYYNEHVKYWVQTDCTACGGSGYYDSDGSPDCGGCDGTGKKWYKPDYTNAMTPIEDLIGKTLTKEIGDLVDLLVYVNKRREVIYQYENLADPNTKVRIRARLSFEYTRDGSGEDWMFEDRYGNTYYMSEFTEYKNKDK